MGNPLASPTIVPSSAMSRAVPERSPGRFDDGSRNLCTVPLGDQVTRSDGMILTVISDPARMAWIAWKYLPHDFPPHTQPHERPRAAERSHAVASASPGGGATKRN
jgi:hypothetical protein